LAQGLSPALQEQIWRLGAAYKDNDWPTVQQILETLEQRPDLHEVLTAHPYLCYGVYSAWYWRACTRALSAHLGTVYTHMDAVMEKMEALFEQMERSIDEAEDSPVDYPSTWEAVCFVLDELEKLPRYRAGGTTPAALPQPTDPEHPTRDEHTDTPR